MRCRRKRRRATSQATSERGRGHRAPRAVVEAQTCSSNETWHSIHSRANCAHGRTARRTRRTFARRHCLSGMPDVRKAQAPAPLDRDAFRDRFSQSFVDPAFAVEQDAIARLETIAWHAYETGRKAPLTHAARPRFCRSRLQAVGRVARNARPHHRHRFCTQRRHPAKAKALEGRNAQRRARDRGGPRRVARRPVIASAQRTKTAATEMMSRRGGPMLRRRNAPHRPAGSHGRP